MRYLAFVTDYDGTIAQHSKVPESTVAQLKRLAASGRKLILCTGREIRFLRPDFLELELFDLIVAENGATLYFPNTDEEKLLCDPPKQSFVKALQDQGVSPLSVGKSIVATWEPFEKVVFDEIHKQGLDLHVIFNKGAVMVLPGDVNKATGLMAALHELGISRHNAVGIGDAENDHAFLKMCEFSAATANALDSLKESVDFVTKKDHGYGVEELIEAILKDDLKSLGSAESQLIAIGKFDDDEPVYISPYGHSILICGSSGSGKTTFTSGLVERLRDRKYQFCIIDPEGDYENTEGVLTLGDPKHVPPPEQVIRALQSEQNAAVNLLGMKVEDRPAYLLQLLPRLQALRAKFGRPHWIVIDEAHHMLSDKELQSPQVMPQNLDSAIFVTVHPAELSRTVLDMVKTVFAIGENGPATMKEVLEVYKEKGKIPSEKMQSSEALIFQKGKPVRKMKVELPKSAHLRHRRKYSEGNLGVDRSFVFRGPENRLKLRAQNLQIFMQIGDGVDDETWNFHLRNHDYSKWFREQIKDEHLAKAAEGIENDETLDSLASRAGIRAQIEQLYTMAAK
jgi:HAD superfamily hydrolase (TIGR01484 family)